MTHFKVLLQTVTHGASRDQIQGELEVVTARHALNMTSAEQRDNSNENKVTTHSEHHKWTFKNWSQTL